MKITLEYNGDQKIELPQKYEDFKKKMEEFQIVGSDFIFVNDQKEKSKINTPIGYQKMLKQIPTQHNPRLQVAKKLQPIIKREESSSEDERENLTLIQETDFVDIFYNNAKFIPCQCKFCNKSPEQCPYCKDSNKIPIEGFKNELKQYFIEYFKDNFIILKDYIQQHFKIKIKSFSEWLLLHKQLVNFDIQEEFLFLCISCKEFKSYQHTVYVQQCQYPQKPVCVECFKKQEYRFQKYEKLVSIKNTLDDIQSLRMPKLKQ